MNDSAPAPGWWRASDGIWHPPPNEPAKATQGVDAAPSAGWVKGADGLWHPPHTTGDTTPTARKSAPATRPATGAATAAGAAASPPSASDRSRQSAPTPTIASTPRRAGPTPTAYATGPAPSSSGLSTAALAWLAVGAVALVIVIAIAAIAASTSPTNNATSSTRASSPAASSDEPAAPQVPDSPSAARPTEATSCDQSWAAFEGTANELVVDLRQTLLACNSAAEWASGWSDWNVGSNYALTLVTLCGGHPEIPEISPPPPDPPSAETINSPTCTTFFDRCHTPFRPGCLESSPTANDPPPSDDGPGYVDQSDLEADIRQQVEIDTGRQNPNVSCPGELMTEPGATLECEASFDGDGMFYPVTVEFDSLTGDNANYYIIVGTPLPPGE